MEAGRKREIHVSNGQIHKHKTLLELKSVISITFTLASQDVCSHKFKFKHPEKFEISHFIDSCSHTSVKPLMLLMI